MDKQLLDILVCPLCKGALIYLREQQELVCLADKLAYPIRDDIPVMLDSEARKLSLDEYDALHKRRTSPVA
ncbi:MULTISPECIES: Trm112 family protein [Methylococcus]|uniref:UPF0434 protein N4J17_09065 n=1 Tax=Methylococcus capsulatus TaxID=414 RepID=A0ABZ2F2B8_METCP|nr:MULTISPECIES: Trm112 family protein [Methylococcus]MDF9391437.1 Trm112 family protein [Methylococcus capsulatus]